MWEQKVDPVAQEKLDFEYEAKAAAQALMQARPASSEKSVRFSEDRHMAKPAVEQRQPYTRKFKQPKMRKSATVQFNCDRVRKDLQDTDDDTGDVKDEGEEEEH